MTETRTKPRILVMGHATTELRIAGASVVVAGTTDRRVVEAIAAGEVDGLLLTGGSDVDPKLYGQTPHRSVYGVNPARDLAEFEAIVAADAAGIPILGICRGAQMMNVAYGGTLHQHVPALKHSHGYHQGHDHRVKAAKGSRLARAWKSEVEWVVSIHHQAVDEVAPGFVATAWGLDGIIETIESVEGWRVGVQFHPEIDGKATSQRLFNSFVRAAAKAAGMTTFRVPSRRSSVKSSDRGGDRYWARRAERVVADAERAAPLTRDMPSIGVPRKKRAAAGEAVLSKWRCFRCSMPDFDERADYIDHMLFIHNVDVLSKEKVKS